jgi:tRNA-splicing ligase RtcB (3'-phosphate/5'-hydroxy nucleic acid ligase)
MIAWKLDDMHVPVKSWCTDAEKGALDQINNAARLPFAFHHAALMPDAHSGYGAPIGGVLATKGYIIPNFVGVDGGCGLCALNTGISLDGVDETAIKGIMGLIRQRIPVGFEHHKEAQPIELMPFWIDDEITDKVIDKEYSSALHQIGTLGGGNHFIELQKDDDRNLWVMIHSGSRNLGKQVADFYNKKAVELNQRYFSSVPKEWDLAFLPDDDEWGRAYLTEMHYCVQFALANRKLMMNRVAESISDVLSLAVDTSEMINIAHNYANIEHHFGQNVWVHRKGATQAFAGKIGIIPGSQGTHSYIVKGLGNPESFNSCSHGAGRKMGRKEAQRSLDLADEIAKMDAQGIIHGIRTIKDLDEASGAYKDVDVVMENQTDLVEIVTKLSPIAVIKG